MCRDKLETKINSEFESKGYKVKIISANRLFDLRNDIEKYHEQGLFDLSF